MIAAAAPMQKRRSRLSKRRLREAPRRYAAGDPRPWPEQHPAWSFYQRVAGLEPAEKADALRGLYAILHHTSTGNPFYRSPAYPVGSVPTDPLTVELTHGAIAGEWDALGILHDHLHENGWEDFAERHGFARAAHALSSHEKKQKLARRGRRRRYSGMKAPRGGFIARGVYYPGGRFLPAPLGYKSRRKEQGHQPKVYSRKGPELPRAEGPVSYANERPGERVANSEDELLAEIRRYTIALEGPVNVSKNGFRNMAEWYGGLEAYLNYLKEQHSMRGNSKAGYRQGTQPLPAPAVLPEPQPEPEVEMYDTGHGNLIPRPKRS